MTSKGFVSWALDGHTYDEHTPLYVDSEDATRFLTAADVIVEVRKLVSGLRKHGLKKGDRVLVCTAQNIHYTSRFLAVIGAGGVFTGMNVMSVSAQLLSSNPLRKRTLNEATAVSLLQISIV